MLTLVSLCCLVTYLLAYRLLFARSFLGFSIRDRQLSGLLYLFYDMMFVLPALILVPMIGPDAIRVLSHYVTDASVPGAVLWVWYGIFAFGLTFWLVRAGLGTGVGYRGHDTLEELETHQSQFRLLTFGRMLALGIVLVLSYSLFAQGAKHAFLHGLLQNIAPGALRYHNANIAGLSYIKHFINVSCTLIAILLACPPYQSRKLERLLLLSVVVIGSTFYGSKSPLIVYLFAYTFAAIELQPRLNVGLLVRKLGLGMGALFVLLAVIVFMAGRDGFDTLSFLDYFWNRVFIGQMAGWFEQWNLLLWQPDYVNHAIPFASLVTDYPVFHKDLMLISEGKPDGANIGIKVTYFLAEAYAMLGWPGLVLSPFIMAVQFMITFIAFTFLLRKLVFGTPGLAGFTASYFFVSFFSTTDGLSEMLAYKGLTILLIIVAPAAIATWVITQIAATRQRTAWANPDRELAEIS